MAVDMYTRPALAALGVDDELEVGPVTAREERMQEAQRQT
jgi:hypothetical protein